MEDFGTHFQQLTLCGSPVLAHVTNVISFCRSCVSGLVLHIFFGWSQVYLELSCLTLFADWHIQAVAEIVTVAILAQGTSWAVAVMQAFLLSLLLNCKTQSPSILPGEKFGENIIHTRTHASARAHTHTYVHCQANRKARVSQAGAWT